MEMHPEKNILETRFGDSWQCQALFLILNRFIDSQTNQFPNAKPLYQKPEAHEMCALNSTNFNENPIQ